TLHRERDPGLHGVTLGAERRMTGSSVFHINTIRCSAAASFMSAALLGGAVGCSPDSAVEAEAPVSFTGAAGEVRLVTLEPGHFHAALVQKYAYDQIDSVVHVYAPAGPELNAHIGLIEGFNTRADDPTAWDLQLHTDPDYVERLF